MRRPPATCDSAVITALAREGAPEALDRIAECYLDHLRGVGRCACGDPQGAEDAVQDALVAAKLHLDDFRGEGTIEAWLSRLVVNACHARRRGRKNDPTWNLPLDTAPEPHAEDAHQCVARAQLVDHLARALSTLSERDRWIFLMTEREGWSAPELAEATGCTPAAVRKRLSRIRGALRQELESVWSEWR
ncbi:MAG: sigma-70 family RNA polymerase sigma factor [Myxococcales bacterium]|nr:sigma-70 family RNA polymerase sigma factor [Myxococcales bacterium]MCB9648242.1 sigma-70 family RNA polymerase sigma factor [Deltaproteobacteria bacterium]